tara:strand:- start:297 stop:809 length:513 start_codon:yes stop_codon:yes gene_type:complete
MKYSYLLAILFLFACSDTNEKSELDRCINANINLIQNITIDKLNESPELFKLPVKMDIDFFMAAVNPGLTLELDADILAQEDKNAVKEYLKSLQESGELSEDLIINSDDEEISISVVERGKIFDLKDVVDEFDYDDEEEAKFISDILSSTIRFSNVDEIAKKTCWSQGIY